MARRVLAQLLCRLTAATEAATVFENTRVRVVGDVMSAQAGRRSPPGGAATSAGAPSAVRTTTAFALCRGMPTPFSGITVPLRRTLVLAWPPPAAMWTRLVQRAAAPAFFRRAAVPTPCQQRLLARPLQLLRPFAKASSSAGRKASRGAAGRAAIASADAGVPTSDGFHAAEVRLQDADDAGSDTTVVGLRGFFVGQKLDTAALAADIAGFFPLYAQIQGRHNTIFALDEEHAEHPDIGCYMVCFDFGAVVFCNTKNLDVIGQQLVHARGFCERPLEEPSAEEYEIMLDPEMKAWSEISEHNGVGCVRMRELNINNMRIVSTVLAQSVALENYEAQANTLMQEFLQTNNTVQHGGSRALLKKESLFKLVAANNSILSDIMINLGVLNRASGLEWRIDSYYSLWENLRDEFELERRFQSVEDKLGLIADNARFFLEVLSHRKSEKLEWIIIVLISCEIAFAVVDHLPPGVFATISNVVS